MLSDIRGGPIYLWANAAEKLVIKLPSAGAVDDR
jgi:hypothetical protein